MSTKKRTTQASRRAARNAKRFNTRLIADWHFCRGY